MTDQTGPAVLSAAVHGVALHRLFEFQELEESPDLVTGLSWMSHRVLVVDDVLVTTADPSSFEEPSVDEIGDDPLSGTLGDSDVCSNVAESNVRLLRDPKQYLGVVRHERPGSGRFT